jgi:hypothetical protein
MRYATAASGVDCGFVSLLSITVNTGCYKRSKAIGITNLVPMLVLDACIRNQHKRRRSIECVDQRLRLVVVCGPSRHAGFLQLRVDLVWVARNEDYVFGIDTFKEMGVCAPTQGARGGEDSDFVSGHGGFDAGRRVDDDDKGKRMGVFVDDFRRPWGAEPRIYTYLSS